MLKTPHTLLVVYTLFFVAASANGGTTRRLRVSEPTLTASLSACGARFIADYGGFKLVEIDAGALPARLGYGIELAEHMEKIELNVGHLHTRSPAARMLRKPRGVFAGRRLHLVQFVGPVKPEWRAELESTGVHVVSYIPHNSYLVYGDAPALAVLQTWAGTNEIVQWEGEFVDEFKIQPHARAAVAKALSGQGATDTFAVQLIEDTDANPDTLALIERLQLEPIKNEFRILHYRNVIVRLPADRVSELAARPDVVSIQAYPPRHKLDERQSQIIAGNLVAGMPAGPGYLDWLASKGFSQAQFADSGFAVDVSDSGIDNGTITPGHFGLYELGQTNSTSRVVYYRLVGKRNMPGSTLQGCDGHGALNAHIIAGYNDMPAGFPHTDAAGFRYGLGVCPFVRVGSSVIFDPDEFTNPNYNTLVSWAYNDGARISNNSWGGDTSGAYDVDAQVYDALVRDAQPDGAKYPAPGNQQMVIVFAAGNEGPATQSINSPGSAKNVVTVGATENVRSLTIANGGNNSAGNDGCNISDFAADNADDIASFSSRGPCADGRMKPDLVAPGTHVTGGVPQSSPPPPPTGLGAAIACFDSKTVCALPGSGSVGDPDNFFPLGQQFYTVSSGTSHSTPAVAGACALLRQYFINLGMPVPSPAMTKAYLINSARYLTGAYANDTLWSQSQGMGAVNLGMAFDGVQRILRDQVASDKFIATGQTRTFVGVIADPAKPFRVTLAWTDAPGSTVGAAYKNDLDLTVAVAGNVYKGNVFSGAFSVTGGSADPKNNVESVFLPAGLSGPFVVTVTAANINSDGVPNEPPSLDQDFALVIYNAVEAADIALDVSNAAVAINLGTQITLVFAVTNLGPCTADAVVVTNLLPAGLEFVSANTSRGSWTHDNGVAVFDLGQMQPSETATITVNAAGVSAGWWTNTAAVSSQPTDSESSNNTVRVVVFVNSAPNISVIPDIATFESTPAGPVEFAIWDAETPASELSLCALPGDTNLVSPDGIEFAGENTNRTITITPRPGRTGSTIVTVIVGDGMAETTNSFLFTVLPTNHAPVLMPVPDQLIHAQMRLCVTNVAVDPDVPPQTLQFCLDTNAPVNAVIDPVSGVFQWVPDESCLGTNIVGVHVIDDGQPPLSATTSFAVIVFARPMLEARLTSTNELTLSWNAIPGCVYRVQFKSDLDDTQWQDIEPDITASDFVAETVDMVEPDTARFYRVVVVQ